MGLSFPRGPRPLTCRVAAAPPLLLHLAVPTPAPPAALDDAGLEASSPSPPPPRIPGAAARRGRRGAVTETPRAPPPPPDTRAWRPACVPHPQRLRRRPPGPEPRARPLTAAAAQRAPEPGFSGPRFCGLRNPGSPK
ncbi:uncharacterized protein LOC144579303 [Callithrix jacchus]